MEAVICITVILSLIISGTILSTYFLAYRVGRGNKHIRALMFFLLSVFLLNLIIGLKTIFSILGHEHVIFTNKYLLLLRWWFFILTGTFFIHTSWSEATNIRNVRDNIGGKKNGKRNTYFGKTYKKTFK